MTTHVEIFPWNENFATGIGDIDNQHKRLVELLNLLVSHLAFQSDAPSLGKVVEELKAYTVEHFSTEERIWGEYFKNDAWEQWHKDAHANFEDKVVELTAHQVDRPYEEIIEEIVGFLTHWLALHIIESDKRMAKVVLAMPSGLSLEQAKDLANQEMTGATRVLIDTVMGMYDNLATRTIQMTREINRRIKAEAELMAVQVELVRVRNEAVAANDAKSSFLANISHEIRTPMNGVIGMTEVMLKTHLSDQQHKMMRVIHDSALAQLAILNDILDFSKIEAGKLSLTSERFALADVIERVCAGFGSHAQEKRVSLRHEVDSRIPRNLDGDDLRLRQILGNFISNAIKFSSGLDRQGKVELITRLSEGKDVGDERVWIEFDVRDNGIGMDQATLGRLFNPFVQADASATRKYGGTGLGLVISQRLAEAMGGTITVESVLGTGTCVTVQLPFAEADSTKLTVAVEIQDLPVVSGPLPTRDEAILMGCLILVAEDNEINQEVIRQQLAMLGYQCDVVSDGQAAFGLWLSGNYSLVLSDIHMPKMDGYRLSESIRAEEARIDASRIPILALTANVLPGEAQRCQAAGMDDWLAKPVPLSQLIGKLTHWLRATDSRPKDVVPAKAEARQSEVPAFDPDMLTRMVGDDPALRTRLLEKFRVSAQEKMGHLRTAMASGEVAAVARVAHGLNSAARSIGAMRLGELCERLELAGKAGDVDQTAALLITIEPIWEDVVKGIDNQTPG